MKTTIIALLCILSSLGRASTRECSEPEHVLPADIDAVKTPPCSEVWDQKSSASSVAAGKLGPYRVLGNVFRDRMAYLFLTDHPGDLIRLTLTYPDDAPRSAEIYVLSEADSSYGMTSLGTGYFTGSPYPMTNRLIEQTFYLHAPGSRKFGIVIMTAAPARPAALTRIKAEIVEPGEAKPVWPGESKQPGRRKIGMYWEDQVFQQNFGELSVPRMKAPEREAAFRRALDRHVSYMHRIRHNLVIDPVVWYNTALFQPSPEYNADSRFTGLRPPDFDRWMADRYSKEGFDYWPSIRSWSLPSLSEWVKPAADIRAGSVSDYVNAVDQNGVVLTKSAWHSVPMLNAFHPRVQAALKNLVADIMGRIGVYDSVKGIALWTTIHSTHGLGTIDQSFDDYTLQTFSADTGIALPHLEGVRENRFGEWSKWLRAKHWDAWISWRKRKQTELYYALADIIARKKPGAKLNLMVFYPVPTMTVGLTVNDVGAYLDGVGLDLEALSRHPNITISRMILAHQYQNQLRSKPAEAPAMEELLERSRLDFSKEWQKPFVGRSAGAVIQYSYFEGDLSRSERLKPQGWRSGEPGWHVTSPKAAGVNAMEYLARSIALYDPQFLAYGGFQMGTQGLEETVPPLAAAFTSLPAIRFSTIAEQDGVVVRSALAEGFRWIYVVNATPEERSVRLDFAKAGLFERVAPAGPNAASLKGASVRVTVPAWGLAVYRTAGEVGPPAVKRESVPR
jgi:hypothetical protein